MEWDLSDVRRVLGYAMKYDVDIDGTGEGLPPEDAVAAYASITGTFGRNPPRAIPRGRLRGGNQPADEAEAMTEDEFQLLIRDLDESGELHVQLPGGLGQQFSGSDQLTSCHSRAPQAQENGTTMGKNAKPVVKKAPPGRSGDGFRPLRLSDVVPEEVAWLWTGRIPLGTLLVLSGNPSCGKSTVASAWGSHVSRGKDWPDGTPCKLGSVLLLTAEEVLATVRGRFEAAGADMTKVHAMTGSVRDRGRLRDFSLPRDLKELERVVREIGDVKLLIIDPLTSYLSGANTNSESKVRAAVGPLKEFAERHGIAVVGVAHLNKAGRSVPQLRLLGSVAIPAIARAVYLVTDYYDGDPGDRVLKPVKFSLGPCPPAVRFRIVNQGGAGKVEFLDCNLRLADDDLARGGHVAPSSYELATAWLREQLKDGPVAATVLYAGAKHEGIAGSTLVRVKKKMGVISRRRPEVGMKWFWSLPKGPGSPKAAAVIPAKGSPKTGSLMAKLKAKAKAKAR